MRKNLLAAAALAAFFSVLSAASADELTGTLAKVKELGYVTIGHREASISMTSANRSALRWTSALTSSRR